MNRKCVRTTVVKSTKILFTLLLNQQNLNKFINNADWLHTVNSDTSHTTIDFAHLLSIHGFQLIQAYNKIEQNEKEQNFHFAEGWQASTEKQMINRIKLKLKELDLNFMKSLMTGKEKYDFEFLNDNPEYFNNKNNYVIQEKPNLKKRQNFFYFEIFIFSLKNIKAIWFFFKILFL
ncbi:hypothetical protein BpHYR1_016744 [Brachionus plicatilis]|uniref:Uncharacterized protein n=1 Tax=Brachionus plicatilis TaxID=10195 RepID=A0A3M7Q2L7_BRAPC|nr:hypothetical protein BpHYR1_016744 [Brachionus plicatilis]